MEPWRNVELKAFDRRRERTLASALALGACDHGVLHQRDTYFHAPHGRLKLREAPPAPAELIAYSRDDVADLKVTDYRIAPVAEPPALVETLGDALGIRLAVEKERRLLCWGNVRIHIDRVSGLGSFME